MITYKMADVVKEISVRENNPTTSEYDKFVGLEHYITGEVVIRQHGGTGMLNSAMKVFQAGDILVARRNVYLRRASMVDFDGLTSGDSIVLRAENPRIAKLLPFILNSNRFWDYADQHADGTMSKRLSPKILMQYEFTLPCEEEQDRLIDLLWSMDRTKQAYKRLISATDELVKSQFIEMFGDPDTNPKQWTVKSIGDIATDVHYGTSKPAVEGGIYPYLRMNNLTADGYIDLTDLKYIDLPENELDGCLVHYGDILFNRTNSKEWVGKTALFDQDQDMVIAGYIIRVRVNSEVLPCFLVKYMNLPYMKKMLRGMAKGAVHQANINAKEMQSIKLYIPPIELQEQFVAFVRQTDKSKFELTQALEALNATYKKLISENLG